MPELHTRSERCKNDIEYKFSTIYSNNKFKLSSLQQTQNKQTLVFTSQYFL